MRDILERCIRIDRMAAEAYADLAERCPDGELAQLFTSMRAEELQHQEWWQELLDAYAAGLIPDIAPDPDGLASELDERIDELQRMDTGTAAAINAEEALNRAVRMEFFALDPVFGELIDLLEPGSSSRRHHAYLHHLERLIDAVEHRHGEHSTETFLARMLRRVWKDTRELSRLASTDEVTGLLNRRALDTHLTQWAAWSARYGRPLAVLLMDIDRFKEINDRFGHRAGDTTLATVTHTLAGMLRDSDLLARYGGDEFAVIAPETDATEARALAERLLDSVRGLGIEVAEGDGTIGVTMSIGFAVTGDGGETPSATAERLLSEADRGLYAAKEQGRDRVEAGSS